MRYPTGPGPGPGIHAEYQAHGTHGITRLFKARIGWANDGEAAIFLIQGTSLEETTEDLF